MENGSDFEGSRQSLIDDDQIVYRPYHGSFCFKLRNEFQRKCFGFNFDNRDAFTKSQWHCPWLTFVIYRWILAVYAITITLFSIVAYHHDSKHYPWPVWLTNWSYFMLTCHLVCSAIVSLFGVSDGKPRQTAEMRDDSSQSGQLVIALPFYMKLSWFLFVIGSAAAVVVTVVYFAAVFPFGRVPLSNQLNLHMHLMNSVIVILELSVSGIPVSFLHFVYVLAYCLAYVVFSAIYWSLDHSRVLYPKVLDWNHPFKTLGIMFFLGIVGVPLIQFVLFAAYQLRLFIYRRVYKNGTVGIRDCSSIPPVTF